MKTDALKMDSRLYGNGEDLIAGATPWRARDTLGVYLREAVYQFWSLARMPAFALPTLLFPAMFYLFFGVLFGHGGHSAYFLATYGTFGVMGPALFGFGVGIAMEREHGVLALKRVFPLPTGAYFFARWAMSALFALAIVIILSAIALTLGGVSLAPIEWLTLTIVLVAGTLPFCALGLVVGLSVGGQAAPAIINLIYLPMSFLSGLWVPIKFLPHFLQQLAAALPAYHLGQLALASVHMGNGGSLLAHVGYLALFSLICLYAAVRGWRRIQDR
jgi:ABC-2 type transport system permease protein